VDREQRELYRLTIRLSDTLHTTDISQILLVGFSDTLHTTDISQILLVGFQIISTPQASARFFW
jgi:hypothetical protein